MKQKWCLCLVDLSERLYGRWRFSYKYSLPHLISLGKTRNYLENARIQILETLENLEK